MAGLTAAGFIPATLDEIREGINDSLRAAFGPGIDLTNGSILGQLVGIFSDRLAELWEVAEAVNSSQDPDAATGARLDAIAALTGTQRRAATPSTVTLTLTGDNATLVPSGSRASVTATGDEFATIASATLATVTAWAATTAYALGVRRTNGGNVYQVISAGTSGATGPVGTDPSLLTGEVDGSVVWRFLGEGTAAIDVGAEAVDTGPTVAIAGAISDIETPVSGWSGVVNVNDADLGSDIESDESLRARREIELATPGTSPVDAVRAALLDIPTVTSATVFVNNTDATDADGVPPHAIEALVQYPNAPVPESDQLIWDTLLASVAAGIATYGDEIGTSTDSAGNDFTMAFSRPEELPIYVDVEVIVDPDEYPADGDDLIAAAIVEWGDAQKTGKDVVASAISAQAFTVAGVLDVTTVNIGTSPAPSSSATVAVSLRQLALFDTSRITVTTTEGAP